MFEAEDQSQERRSRTGLPRCRAAYFCLGKSKQNRLRRTRSAAIQPRRSPVLLGRRGTQPKLAALRHGLLFDPAALRCSARSTARLRSRARRKAEAGASAKAEEASQVVDFRFGFGEVRIRPPSSDTRTRLLSVHCQGLEGVHSSLSGCLRW